MDPKLFESLLRYDKKTAHIDRPKLEWQKGGNYRLEDYQESD
jgi:hypothetical protein